ncbi:MAG: glycoside hydrolase family 2 TIM barrel-domain containing protein [Paludibacteraceae bacterium]
MKKLNFIIITLFLIPISALAQVSFGTPQKINSHWKFSLGDISSAQNVYFNDSQWKNIDIPHDWSVSEKLESKNASCMGFLPGGIGWYRKTLNIAANKQGEKVYLYFEGIYNRSKVYVNGHLVGERPNGYISFAFDATPYVKFGAENIIAVRVDHSLSADSRWYSGSGIYRDVWVVYANPIHIAQWGVYAYPEVTGNNAKLNIEVEVQNETSENENLTVKNELINKQGIIVAKNETNVSVSAGKNETSKTTLVVEKPQLWQLESPDLYRLKTTVLKNGNIIDKSVITTGFRTLAFDPDKGFSLNGKNIKLKGVCLHHDLGVLGSALYPEIWKKRLLTLKEIGVNAIRTSHNPQAPAFYDLCDKLGLLVLNEAYDEWEFPKRKWLQGWNVGTPGFEGTSDIFKTWGEKDLEDFVRRDRNHLSVFAWSIGNEVDYPNDPYSHPILDGGKGGFTQPIFGGYKKDAPDAMRLGVIAKNLVKAVKKHDNSRPITAGLAGVAMSNETEYPFVLDIAGYNYTESKYDEDHKTYPHRVIFGSENRHELSAWKAVTDKEFVFGQFLWTGIDYLGESGKWPSRGFYSGLVDFGGYIKPRGFFRQSLWADKPVMYAGTYHSPLKSNKNQMKDVWSQSEAENTQNYREITPSMDAFSIWNYKEGELIRVVCYTNAAKAKLLLNGSEIGKTKPYNQENGMIYWDIPYKSGKLVAVGFDNNDKEVSRYVIQTAGESYAIKIIENDKVTVKNNVAKITIQVVDKNGIAAMLSNDEVTCTVSNNGQLIGLEASDNEDMGDYTDNVQCAFHGRLVAYVKAKSNSGKINVKFTAPKIIPVETEVNITANK